MADNPQHATITFERSYSASPERVFAAFANPAARAQWSAGPNDAFFYDHTDFREGGRDQFRCGPKNDPKLRGETIYHQIVPNKRVISTETLDADGQRMAVSLTTLEFEPTTDGTNLKLTVQLVSLVGLAMIAGYESGNKTALENLARYLAANPRVALAQ
jgi:uncharacterized protein YndB with AHSA1/START domain